MRVQAAARVRHRTPEPGEQGEQAEGPRPERVPEQLAQVVVQPAPARAEKDRRGPIKRLGVGVDQAPVGRPPAAQVQQGQQPGQRRDRQDRQAQQDRPQRQSPADHGGQRQQKHQRLLAQAAGQAEPQGEQGRDCVSPRQTRQQSVAETITIRASSVCGSATSP